jgi:predicted transcriptional regulator
MTKPINLKIDKNLINQSEIARRLGLSRSYICRLLAGQYKSSKRIDQINEILTQISKVA